MIAREFDGNMETFKNHLFNTYHLNDWIISDKLNNSTNFNEKLKNENIFHKIGKIFYNKRLDEKTGKIRYLSKDEFNQQKRHPSYFNHTEILKNVDIHPNKMNDILHENVFQFVDDLESLTNILENFSSTDKFTDKDYKTDDSNKLFYMNHMCSTNAYAITTFNYVNQDKNKFKEIDGKNLFKFSDYKNKRKEDQNQLNDLIFESETDLADGYFLGGFRNYLKDHCNLKNKNSINKKKVANNKQSKYIVKNDFDDKFNKNCTLKTKDNMNFEDLLNKYDIDELDVEDINAEIFIDSAEI